LDGRPQKKRLKGLGMKIWRFSVAVCAMLAVGLTSQAGAGRLRDKFRNRDSVRHGDSVNKLSPALKTEYAYGSATLQKLDFYRASRGNAPLVVFVHGGGWKNGDKSNSTGQNKARHYKGQGYAFASINYRLLPGAPVEQQASDVAQAIAYLRSNAGRLGVDPGRIVLMGHSAGAHLAALVSTDPHYLRTAGLPLDTLRGVIPLDGACYDVPAQIGDGPKMMQDTYRDAFGTDPARQRALSPSFHAASPNAPEFLILHVERDDGARQSAGLAEALRRSGTPVSLQGLKGKGMKGHMEINRSLGDPDYPATPIVDAWLKQVFRR
jgi:acetyl esterase/lipase